MWMATFRRAAPASASSIWRRLPVHQDHPAARVLPVAGPGLAEGGGDDLARAAAPAGHGDHIVWPAHRRGRIVDAR